MYFLFEQLKRLLFCPCTQASWSNHVKFLVFSFVIVTDQVEIVCFCITNWHQSIRFGLCITNWSCSCWGFRRRTRGGRRHCCHCKGGEKQKPEAALGHCSVWPRKLLSQEPFGWVLVSASIKTEQATLSQNLPNFQGQLADKTSQPTIVQVRSSRAIQQGVSTDLCRDAELFGRAIYLAIHRSGRANLVSVQCRGLPKAEKAYNRGIHYAKSNLVHANGVPDCVRSIRRLKLGILLRFHHA